MGKRIILYIFLLLPVLLCAQYGPQKMKEIRIDYSDNDLIHELYDQRFQGDFYADHARLIVTDDQLDFIKEKGIKYNVIIDDLQAHARDFWNNRDEYHTYEEIIDLMDSLVAAFPNICSKTVYGSSIEGREISALKISDNVSVDEYEPEVLFDGGIHGDEIGGAENLIRFAKQLCVEYGSDDEITYLVDNREIWIFPMINPDGRVYLSRFNLNGVDLNRDGGYMWDAWGNSPGPFSQVESKAFRTCWQENQFNINITFHSGVVLFAFPWYYRYDSAPERRPLRYLAQTYSDSSTYANLSVMQGTQLYPTNGSSAESVYATQGTYAFLMEMSSIKQPPASEIMFYYNANYPAMIELLEQAEYGIRGKVTDAISGNPVAASIWIDTLTPFYSDEAVGDFHRFLLSGTYDVKVKANGYITQTIENIVVLDNSSTEVNFQLQPDTSQYAYKILSCQIPNTNDADEGYTWTSLGEPDTEYYSIGRKGWAVYDMQVPIPDVQGGDITVHEGSNENEGYSLYGGYSQDGPWQYIGDGIGTTDFDLANALLDNVRYLKIEDDGDGEAIEDDAGFDLDAIERLFVFNEQYIRMVDYSFMDQGGDNQPDPGDTGEILVRLVNEGPDNATDVSGDMSSDPELMTILTPTMGFGNMGVGDTATAVFDVSIPNTVIPGTKLTVDLQVNANAGSYTFNHELYFTIGKSPNLIIQFDEGPSAEAFLEAFEALGLTADHALEIPDTLTQYENIFVCLGIHPHDYKLKHADGTRLAAFIEENGNIYMEGGDTWFNDPTTPVHPYFNIDCNNGGDDDLTYVKGMFNAFTQGLQFPYDGNNNSIDQLIPENGSFVIFQNASPVYNIAVAFESDEYKTIGTSFEFGGLEDGTSPETKADLLEMYLDFFEFFTSGTEEGKHAHSVKVSPNPFRNKVEISFFNPGRQWVNLSIYDIRGTLVKELINNTVDSGEVRVKWDVEGQNIRSLKNGVFLWALRTNDTKLTGKLILNK